MAPCLCPRHGADLQTHIDPQPQGVDVNTPEYSGILWRRENIRLQESSLSREIREEYGVLTMEHNQGQGKVN